MPKAYWRLQNEKASWDGGLTLPRFPLPSSAPEAGVISLILQIRKGGAQKLRLLKVTQMVSSREQTGTQMGQNPTSGCFFLKLACLRGT